MDRLDTMSRKLKTEAEYIDLLDEIEEDAHNDTETEHGEGDMLAFDIIDDLGYHELAEKFRALARGWWYA